MRTAVVALVVVLASAASADTYKPKGLDAEGVLVVDARRSEQKSVERCTSGGEAAAVCEPCAGACPVKRKLKVDRSGKGLERRPWLEQKHPRAKRTVYVARDWPWLAVLVVVSAREHHLYVLGREAPEAPPDLAPPEKPAEPPPEPRPDGGPSRDAR